MRTAPEKESRPPPSNRAANERHSHIAERRKGGYGVLQSGILLAVGSAFLCGCADICASQGAKRLGALTTTFLALLIGALALALFGALAFERLGLTAQVLVWSMP